MDPAVKLAIDDLKKIITVVGRMRAAIRLAKRQIDLGNTEAALLTLRAAYPRDDEDATALDVSSDLYDHRVAKGEIEPLS